MLDFAISVLLALIVVGGILYVAFLVMVAAILITLEFDDIEKKIEKETE